MAMTTKEMIEVMQAFETGKPIESTRRNDGRGHWGPILHPSWDWDTFDYRIALTKPSWDWSHVSDEINFLVRQSPEAGGYGMGLSREPLMNGNRWHAFESGAVMVSAKFFASYDPGTCSWQDSLVVRPGYVEGAE